MYGKLKSSLCGQDHADIPRYKCRNCQNAFYRNRRRDHPAKTRAASLRAHRRWVERHPEKALEIQRRNDLKAYGLTIERYDAMLRAQDGKCAICGTNSPGGPGNRLVVDHSHTTGTVRSLLCCNCNFIIGHSRESVDTLLKAAEYLQREAYDNLR